MHDEWADALAALIADKTRQAQAATLPPYETELSAPSAGAVALGNAWSERLFDGSFFLTPTHSDRPACSLVFVQSADGNTGARDPAALGGGETDKHVIYEGLSRVAADAVMAGAETIRDGRIVLSVWHPELVALRAALGLPRHPIQIVATLRGVAVDEGLLFNIPEVRVLLLTLPAVSVAMHHALAQRP